MNKKVQKSISLTSDMALDIFKTESLDNAKFDFNSYNYTAKVS